MNTKLKVLMVSDSYNPIIGGREQVIHHLMNEFSNKCSPVLLTANLGLKKTEKHDEKQSYKILRCKSLRLTKNEYLSIMNKQTKNEIENLCKSGLDIIHTQTKYALASHAIKLGKKYNIPVVTTCHTLYPLIYKIQLKSHFLRKIFLSHVRKIINKMDGVITVSNFMKNTLISMGVTKPITVIPNGNDIVSFEEKNFSKTEIKEKYGIKDCPNIFCFVGRINPVKNIDSLFEVLRNLKDKNIEFKILMIGGGQIKKYKKLAKKMNIENEIIFTGAIKNREELAKIYSICDLHLLFSLTETFGMNIRESAAMKTPSVVIENTASSESIKNNENGFVSKNDPLSLTETILNAITEKEKLKVMGEKAKSTLSTTWSEVADKHISYYKSIILENSSKL